MVNRQSRDPGELRQFNATGRVSTDVPSFAADTGSAFRTLEAMGAQLSGQLFKLATEASITANTEAGLRSQQTGASYLQARAAEAQGAKIAATGSRAYTQSSGEVRKLISEAAQRHGVDPAAMLKIAELESSFNPGAKNPRSSAGGLFQFIDSTARQYGLGDRYDPAAASDAAARLAKDNAAHLRRVLGREPSAGELYLAHQQGADGAAKLLGNPTGEAASLVGAEAVRLNGGKPGMTAGEFAGLWVRKAGGAVAPAGEAGAQPVSLPTQPLALRRDGTIGGAAYDAAAIEAYTWRLDQGISNDLSAAHDQFRDDPAGFQQELSRIRDTYLQDESFADPRVREVFEKNFARRAEAAARDVANRQGQRLDAEKKASAGEALEARINGIEKDAYLLGANPDGDRIIGEHIDRAMLSIDAAVAQAALTPAQAAKQRGDVKSRAMKSRVMGVYDALGTPEEKQQFALGLMTDEKLLGDFGAIEIKSISELLFNKALGEGSRKTASDKIENARLEQLIDDDLASLGATGAGLDPAESGLSADLVAGRLGPEKLAAWQDGRRQATLAFQATAGMEADSEADILTRLDTLAPKPGQPGFEQQEAVFNLAAKRAEAVLKERAKDPAMAAEKAFAEVADLAAAADPQDPASMQALVAGRLRGQTALGIDGYGQDPLTAREAKNLAAVLLQYPSGSSQQVKAVSQLVDQVQSGYGPHAELVLAQVVSQTGVDRDTAQLTAGLMSRIASGGTPSRQDAKTVDVMSETQAAERAGRDLGRLAGTASQTGLPTPSYDAIQMLLSSPETAAQFDEVFGPGRAQFYLGQKARAPDQGADTTTFDETGAESWQP